MRRPNVRRCPAGVGLRPLSPSSGMVSRARKSVSFACRTALQVGPSSIYALAKKLGRHYKNVHTDVTALVQLGMIEKDAEGKIFVPWDEIDVNMPLARAA